MFERSHHRRIAQVLESLDGDRLRGLQRWFGGGTAIALRQGKYRESVDIDFLVCDADGYRQLRQRRAMNRRARGIQWSGAPAIWTAMATPIVQPAFNTSGDA